MSASGTIESPGFIRQGPGATGTFILSNAKGSVTIQLTGQPQPGFSAPPRKFTFKIVASTGKFAGDVDRGTTTLDEVVADEIMSPSPSSVIVGPIFGLTLLHSHREMRLRNLSRWPRISDRDVRVATLANGCAVTTP